MIDLNVLTKALGDLEDDVVLDMLREFVATAPSEI